MLTYTEVPGRASNCCAAEPFLTATSSIPQLFMRAITAADLYRCVGGNQTVNSHGADANPKPFSWEGEQIRFGDIGDKVAEMVNVSTLRELTIGAF